ncbi:Ricin B lectin domain-containing protein OS=Streptomyces canus OX=58343 GN=AQJ46_09630 PE=4 SV=1 [Streptomyces canus]
MTNGELRMLPAGTPGAAIRFALDDVLDKALGN